MTRLSSIIIVSLICLFTFSIELPKKTENDSYFTTSIDDSLVLFDKAISGFAYDDIFYVNDSLWLIIHSDTIFNFAAIYDISDLESVAVFSKILRGQETAATTRKGSFRVDPLLPRGLRATTSMYTNSGYDRGHLVPAHEKVWDEECMLQTFFMTNIAPQLEEFNRGCWLDIENYICDDLNQSSQRDTIYCVRGSNILVCDTLERLSDTPIPIPTSFFAAFQIVKGGVSYSLYFDIEQPDMLEDGHDFWDHQVSKDSLERHYHVKLWI